MKDEMGSIKSFDFVEVEELDEKDLKIRELESRIQELEGGKNNVKSVNEYDEPTSNRKSVATNIDESVETKESSSV